MKEFTQLLEESKQLLKEKTAKPIMVKGYLIDTRANVMVNKGDTPVNLIVDKIMDETVYFTDGSSMSVSTFEDNLVTVLSGESANE